MNTGSPSLSRSNGFTIIEMVVVIVVLGILAVTAAPKFLGMSREAKIASLDAFVGAFQNADGIAMGKAHIHNLGENYDIETIPGTNVDVQQNHLHLTAENLHKAMDIDTLTLFSDTGDIPSVFVHFPVKGSSGRTALRDSMCFVQLTRSFKLNPENSHRELGELSINRVYQGC